MAAHRRSYGFAGLFAVHLQPLLLIAALSAVTNLPVSSRAGEGGQLAGQFEFEFIFSSEDFTITLDDDGYHRIDYSQAEGLHHPDQATDWGHPDLPRIARRAVLDRFDSVADLEVIYAEPDTLPGQYLPRPVQPPWEDDPSFMPPDNDIYESATPFPELQAEPIFCGTLRGVRLFEFRLNPIQFVGQSGILIVYKTIQIRVVTADLNVASAGIRLRQRTGQQWSRGRSEVGWIRRTVVNPADFEALYLSSTHDVNTNLGAFNPTEFPSTERNPVELVIITNNSSTRNGPLPGMDDAFARLATWKISSGVPTVLRNVDWIRDHYAGIDTQEQIRNFIIDAYEKWSTDFVLLGGDVDVIPPRRVLVASPPNPPSDLYYGGLDGSMNADGDQWFGEFGEINQADPLHDVWVGRIPAQNAAEAESFIDKLFDYALVPGEVESVPPALYYQRAILATGFVGEVAWPPFILRNGFYTAETIARSVLPSSMHLTRMYEFVDTLCVDETPVCNIVETTNNVFRGKWGPGITEWETTAQLVDSLNGAGEGVGYAYMYHREHSHRYELGGPSHAGGIDCDACVHRTDAPLDEAGVLELTNGPQYFALIGSGSESNAFDFRSVSERLLMSPTGGAIAYLGKSRSQTAASHQIPVDFFDEQFNHGAVRFGEAAAFAIDAQNAFQFAATWNAMGDPTLPLWTEPPAELDVEITPSSFSELGANTFVVDIGVDRDGALICIRNDEVYASDLTVDGKQDFVLNLQSSDTLWVTVSNANTLPVRTFIAHSGMPSEPTVLYQQHEITDTSSTLSNGNDVVEAGERIKIEVEVKNVGGVTAGGTNGTLSAYGSVDFNVGVTPTSIGEIIFIGTDNSQPAAAADSGFGFPANWYGIRPEGVPSLFDEGTDTGVFVWRDFDIPSEPRWNLVARYGNPSVVPGYTLSGSVVAEGTFSDVVSSGLEEPDEFELVTADSIYIDFEVPGSESDDIVSFRARESVWVSGFRDSVVFGPIGTLATAVDTFLIDLDETVADEHELVFVLHVADSTGASVGVSEFAVPVAAPILVHHELDWTKNGLFYSLYPRVKNQGHGRADSVRATLSVVAGTGTITDNTIVFGAIEAGGVGYKGAADPFVVKPSNVSTLKLQITYVNHYANDQTKTWIARPVDLVRPLRATSVELQAGFESMRVLWEVSSAPADLMGANIYRGVTADTTQFIRLNSDVIVGTRVYEDLTNLSGQLYYYAVAIQDSSGNESPLSEVRIEMAARVEHEGWPRRADGGHQGSPTIVDLNEDGDLEILMGGREGLYVWEPDGNEFGVGDDDPATDLPFIALTNSIPFSRGLVGAPAVGDLDGDEELEIVFTRWEDSLFVYNSERELQWRKLLNVNHFFGNPGPGWSSPTLGDIDGFDNGQMEVVIGSWDGVIYAWDHEGNGVLNPDGYFAGTGAPFLFQTPAIAADLNDDGGCEVIIGTGASGSVKGRIMALQGKDLYPASPGDGEADSLWVWNSGVARAYSTPALGLINDTLRVVCTGVQIAQSPDESEIVVLNAATGLRQPHLSRSMNSTMISLNAGNPTPPVLGDVDGDGEPEIIVGGEFTSSGGPGFPADRKVTLYVWDPLPPPGTLSALSDSMPASPMGVNRISNGAVVGDLDGDGRVEIAYGSDSFGFFVWEYDNGFRSDRGWPATLQGEVYGHPAVGDIDTADDALEIVVVDRSGSVHLFDLAEGSTPTIQWAQLGNGPLHQGFYIEQGARAGLGGRPWMDLSEGYPNPFNPAVSFQVVLQEQARARIGVYDVSGRCVRHLIDEVLVPGPHRITWNGRNEGGQRVASGVYFLRVDALGRVDTRRIVLVR